MAVSIVIVDDHAGFRASARRLLEAEGYRVVGEAADGASGLAVARELGPDVVLLDVQLPDLDGFEVAKRMTATDAPAVVLVSSRELDDCAPDLERSGARAFIEKGRLSGATLEAALR